MMNATGQKGKFTRKRGAAMGAALVFAAGLGPGVWLGSYAALLMLARFTGGPADQGWMPPAAVLCGALTGAVCSAAFGLTVGSSAGAACAVGAERLRRALRSRDEDRLRRRRRAIVLPQPGMAAGVRAEILARTSFLDGLRGSLHSVVVVGSAAHGAADAGSDRDIVLICRRTGYAAVQEAVFEHAVATAERRAADGELDITVLLPADAKRLFRLSSPFAFALRHGDVLHDDGFLRGLTAGWAGTAPGREYCFAALYERIVIAYYGSFSAAERAARASGCSLACCSARRECAGLAPAGMPGRVIVRMLYVTLPARGAVPLSKTDLVAFVRQFYGEESALTAEQSIRTGRNGGGPYRYEDHVRFRRLAGVLFREILGIVGGAYSVRGLLADAASIVQGRYGQVRDRTLRSCVQTGVAAGSGRS